MADAAVIPNAPNFAVNPSAEPASGSVLQQHSLGGEGIAPNASDAWWSQVNLDRLGGLQSTAYNWIEDQYNQGEDQKASASPLSQEQIKQLYPGYEYLAQGGPITPALMAGRVQREQKKQQLQDWIARGEPLSGFRGFTAGLYATATSPLDLAAGVVAGEGAGALAEGLGLVGSSGIKGLANIYGQNLVGNIAVQGGTAYLKQQLGQQVDYSDEFKSAATNAALFTGIHYALSGLRSLVGKYPRDIQEQAVKESITQTESGQVADPSRVFDAVQARESGVDRAGADVYRYKQMAQRSLTDRAYYLAHSPDDLQAIDFGGHGGLPLTDHKQFAENLASNPEGGSAGRVTEGQLLPESKTLDLEQRLSQPEAMSFAKEIEKRLGLKLDLTPDMSLKDVLNAIRNQAKNSDEAQVMVNSVQELAKEQGYRGYAYKYDHPGLNTYQDQLPGQRVLPYQSQALSLFDGSSFVPNQSTTPNIDNAPRTPTEPVDLNSQDETKQVSYNPVRDAEIQKLQDSAPKTLEAENTLMKEQEREARRALENPELPPEVQDAVTEIDRNYSNDGKLRKVFNALVDCFLDGNAGGLA